MTYKSVSGGNPDESFNRLPARLTTAVPTALIRAALVLEAATKMILLTPGTGRLREGAKDRVGKGSFRVSEIEEEIPFSQRLSDAFPKTRRRTVRKMVRRGAARTNVDLTNRASSPGEPPAPDSGTLQRSITHEFGARSLGGRGNLGSGLVAATVRVGTNVEYAEPLEFGTTTAGKSHNVVILPRPFMRPAMAASKDQMTEAVVATLKRGNARAN